MTSVPLKHDTSVVRRVIPKEAQPDQQWKNDTRKRIEHTLQSMVDEAQKVRALAWRASPDEESRARATVDYEERMTNIRGLAQEEFTRQLNLEIQERVWGLGQVAEQSKDLVEQQQAILDSIQKDEALGQSSRVQPVASSSKLVDRDHPSTPRTHGWRSTSSPKRKQLLDGLPRIATTTPVRQVSASRSWGAHETVITFDNTSDDSSDDSSDDGRGESQGFKTVQAREVVLTKREQRAGRREEEAIRMEESVRRKEEALRELEETARLRERALEQKAADMKRQDAELKRRESELRMREIKTQRQDDDMKKREEQAAVLEEKLRRRDEEIKQKEAALERRLLASLEKEKEVDEEQKWKAAEEQTQRAAAGVWRKTIAEQRREGVQGTRAKNIAHASIVYTAAAVPQSRGLSARGTGGPTFRVA